MFQRSCRYLVLTSALIMLAACSLPANSLFTVTPTLHTTTQSVIPVSLSTPSSASTLIPENIVTGTTKSGQPIAVVNVKVTQIDVDNEGYRSTYKILVLRGDSTFWLKSSNTPNKFGCDIEVGGYDTFGCYFGSNSLIDLDKDGEPEIVSRWEHDGSGGSKSLNLYRWDGNAYQLIGEFFEPQLQVEIQTVETSGQQNIILRYRVGPPHSPIPWIDVYTLSSRQLVSINDQYPGFYQELLVQYEKILPEYEAAVGQSSDASDELAELKHRIEMVKVIIGSEP